jgi:hypothetical protein
LPNSIFLFVDFFVIAEDIYENFEKLLKMANMTQKIIENFEKPQKTSKTSPKLFIEEKGERGKSKSSIMNAPIRAVNQNPLTFKIVHITNLVVAFVVQYEPFPFCPPKV